MIRAVLTFDDGFVNDYKSAYHILKQKGIKGTSYLITSRVGDMGYLKWWQIKKMALDGWDFQCHSHTHKKLAELTEQEIRQEMENVNSAFKENGLKAEHHAYPYGEYTDREKNIIKEYRLTARSTYKDKLGVERVGGYGFNYDIPSLKLHLDEQIIDKIDRAEDPVVFHTHDIGEKPSKYGLTPERFEEIVDYMIKKEFKFLTIKQLYASL